MNARKLIIACNENYYRDGRCDDCPNIDCQGGCGACLDSIHMNRINRRYNCPNIVNYYVCKYLPKYMSEIYHLFANNKWLDSLDNIKILSIGCGPSSELFGVARYLFDTKQKKPISYIGFDLNEYWKPIHEQVYHRSRRSKLNIEYKIYYENIFNIYNIHSDKLPHNVSSNVLILQYLISDMVSNNENVIEFIDLTKEYIVKRMAPGSFIIINDINHFNARNYFDSFYGKLTEIGDYSCKRYHFVNNNRDFYAYGEQHKSNQIVIDIPDFSYEYNVWTFCSSSQMVIRKNS